MVENDNDADTGTNAGRVKGKFLYSYFVRRVYVFRYPTAHSHPCKLTCEILALSVWYDRVVENNILFFRVATTRPPSRYIQRS
jgi:hypothetical protein